MLGEFWRKSSMRAELLPIYISGLRLPRERSETLAFTGCEPTDRFGNEAEVECLLIWSDDELSNP